MIVLGALAAYPSIIKAQPNAREIIDKITPYQGWIGVIGCILGLIGMIRLILAIGAITVAPIYWLIGFGASFIEFALGLLLGYGLIHMHALSKNPHAARHGDELRAKLIGYQVPMGYIAIALGVISLILLF
ncbi:MAG: hypothetical protein R3E60_01930 [Alphaproteobacteria bacterium]